MSDDIYKDYDQHLAGAIRAILHLGRIACVISPFICLVLGIAAISKHDDSSLAIVFGAFVGSAVSLAIINRELREIKMLGQQNRRPQ